jgi:phosphonoacetaldehyde hydrolase
MNIKAVIFDWAGTLVDNGSRAPVATLKNVFDTAGVPITVEEARRSMGIAKKSHIREILAIERVSTAWSKQHGHAPCEEDVNRLYADFEPKQLACLGEFSEVIAGVPAAFEQLRRTGVKISSTTGYTRPMLDFLVSRAREQGCAPDLALCPEDVPGGGRPLPYMCYRSAIDLRVFPLSQMVKIGDTPSDVAEGLNAGMWTIGITRTGNETGLTESEWSALSGSERAGILQAAAQRLWSAGAHYIAESVADCVPVLEQISIRIDGNETPHKRA